MKCDTGASSNKYSVTVIVIVTVTVTPVTVTVTVITFARPRLILTMPVSQQYACMMNDRHPVFLFCVKFNSYALPGPNRTAWNTQNF